MDLIKYIEQNDVEKSNHLVDAEFIQIAENEICVKFGKQLTEYLLNYGYLAYGSIELYGINARQKLKSDMIVQSLYLHKYFPCTTPFIAIESTGEGIYYLIDRQDNVYKFIPEFNNELLDMGISFYEHILKRFISEE